MALSVFTPVGGRDQYHGGTFRAEDVNLTWTGIDAFEGALVQEAQWRCARQISMLYEIGSPAVYYVGNRRSGSASLRRVVGSSQTFASMATTFGNICAPQDLIIDARQEGCGRVAPLTTATFTGGGIKYTLKDATLNELGGAIQAESVIISENMSFVFVDLYYDGTLPGV
jgi:hypothetical protein